ncbi:MAG: hypothetical protein PHI67_05865 [Candidatus Methanomethylophilaceae archaeon]|nr:hypothetical protein [Candidatus Methanomethylophilaceae archaeon]
MIWFSDPMTATDPPYKFPYKLFIALMLLTFVPTIYQTFRVYFLVTTGSVTALDVVGQIEWFDLINETLQAFLLIPMYYLLSKFLGDKQIFASKITQACLITFIVYLVFSVFVYLYSLNLVSFMVTATESIAEITTYLQLETIAFTIGILGSFYAIVYVLIGKSKYIYALLITKSILIIFGDSILIPEFGVNGIAYTNILLNTIVAVVSIGLLHFEGLLCLKVGEIIDFNWLVDWVKTGFFSGSQVFLDNLIYVVIIVKMVNDVAEVGNYWIANNFIWGWLLVPVIALAEIIKKESTNGCRRESMVAYLTLNGIILGVWALTLPTWTFVFRDLMGIANPAGIFRIVTLLVPFYVFYNLSSLFDNIFYGMGKTAPVFITSVVVNIGYYGIVYLLFMAGVFTASMQFVILMFGCGMIVHFVCISLLYLAMVKKPQLVQRYHSIFTTD